MDRGLSRSLPFLPRYHSVSPVRAPRRFSSTRSLSQPSQRILYINGERSRLSNHYAQQPPLPPHSPRHVSPFHSLTSPAPKNKGVKVILLNTRLNTPLFRKSNSNSWNDINSSHVYSSLESLYYRQRKIFNKPERVTTASSCDDIYHKGPFFPDASHSESGISVGESEEDGRERRGREEEEDGEDDTDAASQYSYASSSAFFDATLDSEFDRGESDNDVFSNDGKSSPAVPGCRGHYGKHHGSDRTLVMSPLSSYVEARRRELMTSPSWELLEKMSPSRQLFHQNQMQNSSLKVSIPESEHVKHRNGSNNGGVSTPLAQSTPHVSPKGFYGPPMLAVKGSWNADSDSAISSRPMSTLSENDSNSNSPPNSRCSSFSEDYSMTSDYTSPTSKSGRNIKLEKKVFEKPMYNQNISVLSSGKEGKNDHDSKGIARPTSLNLESKFDILSTHGNPDIYIPPLESVIDLDETTLAASSYEDEDETTPRAGQWWAVYNIESAKARKEAEFETDGHSSQEGGEFCNRDDVKIVKPVKTGIPLISPGKYGQEKLKKTPSPPPEGNERKNGEANSRRSLSFPRENISGSCCSSDDGDGDGSRGSRRKSPPLLSLSPKLLGRVLAKQDDNDNSTESNNDKPTTEEAIVCQGKEPWELKQPSDQCLDNVGNLPCSLRRHQHRDELHQGVSATPQFDFGFVESQSQQVTSSSSYSDSISSRSNASTPNASSTLMVVADDGRRGVAMSRDKSVRSHGQSDESQSKSDHQNNSMTTTTTTMMVASRASSLAVGSPGGYDDNNDGGCGGSGGGVDQSTLALANNNYSNIHHHQGHYLLDNNTDKVGTETGVPGIGHDLLGGGNADSGGGGIVSNYDLPDDDTKAIEGSQVNTTTHSPFSRHCQSSKGEEKNDHSHSEESGCFGFDTTGRDSGICEDKSCLGDDFKTLNTNFNFDDKFGDDSDSIGNPNHNTNLVTGFVDSPRVVKLCEEFQALTLSDLDPNATTLVDNNDNAFVDQTPTRLRRQLEAPDGLDAGRGRNAGNENVNINIDTVTGSKAASVDNDGSIRKETVVLLQLNNTNNSDTIGGQEDVADSILNRDAGIGKKKKEGDEEGKTGELELETNNGMTRCCRCGKATQNPSSNVLSSLSCLSCHRGEKRNPNENGGEGIHEVCYQCNRLHKHNVSGNHNDECGSSGDEKRDGEKEGGIGDDEHRIVDGKAIATAHLPPVTREANNDRDSSESIDGILFDVRDDKILLTLSTTPGNIISITHTATPIHKDANTNMDSVFCVGDGCRGCGVNGCAGLCNGDGEDESRIAQGEKMPLQYNSNGQNPVTGSSSGSIEMGSYEEMIIPELGHTQDYRPPLLTHPPHYHSNDYSDYKDGNRNGGGGGEYFDHAHTHADGIPEDREGMTSRSNRWSENGKSGDGLLHQQLQEGQRFCQDFCQGQQEEDASNDMRSSSGRSGSGSRMSGDGGIIRVINANGDEESIRLSSSSTGGGGGGLNSGSGSGGGGSGSAGGGWGMINTMDNKGISQQDHAPKVGRGGVGIKGDDEEEIRESITDAQKDGYDQYEREGRSRSGGGGGGGGVIATAPKSTTRGRQSDNNTTRDSEFLLQRENGRLSSCSIGRQPPVTSVDGDIRVNSSSSLPCGGICDSSSSGCSCGGSGSNSNATTTTKIVKKIHRKTVEETVTIERTVSTPTSRCENSRSGVFIDDNINSGSGCGGCSCSTCGGQLLTVSGSGEDTLSDCRILDSVKSSTDSREDTVVVEEKVDYISTCGLSNSFTTTVDNDLVKTTFCAIQNQISEISAGDCFSGTVSRQNGFDSNSDNNGLRSSNGAERSNNSTDGLTSGPVNPPHDCPTNSTSGTSHFGDETLVKSFHIRPDDFNNTNNNNTANTANSNFENNPQDDSDIDTMRGDKNTRMIGTSGSSGRIVTHSNNNNSPNQYNSNGFEPQHNVYAKTASSPGAGSQPHPSPNQSVLDNLQEQLSNISNGGGDDGGVSVMNNTINVTPAAFHHNIAVALHHQNHPTIGPTNTITTTATDFVDSQSKSCKTYHDQGQAVTSTNVLRMTQSSNTDAHTQSQYVDRVGRGDVLRMGGQYSYSSNVSPQYTHVNTTNTNNDNNNGVSTSVMGRAGQMSPSPNMECVTGAGVTFANNNTPSQNNNYNRTEIRESYDNDTNSDYDYVTSDSSSPSSSQNFPRNNHHNLVLLKPGHAKSSSLWTLQEETESLLDGLSPKQTTTPSPNILPPFHRPFSGECHSMDTNNNNGGHSVISPDGNCSSISRSRDNSNYLPPPVEFMDENENTNVYNYYTNPSSRGGDVSSGNYYSSQSQRKRFSDYSEINEKESSDGNYSSPMSDSSTSRRLGQGSTTSTSIDQEVAKSLSDIETTLRALNGDSKFDYSSNSNSNQRPGIGDEASFSLHVPPVADNSFYDFVSGLGAAGSSDFTFDFANKSHASSTGGIMPGMTSTEPQPHPQHAPLSLITPDVWTQQNTTHGSIKFLDNKYSSHSNHHHHNNNNTNNSNNNNVIEDQMNSSIASSSNLSCSNYQDTQNEASSRLQILDLDLSRISSCGSPSPSDLSEGSSSYTCRGTAEIKRNMSVSFDDDYDMLPAISTPRFLPSSTPRKQTMQLKSALKKPKTAVTLESKNVNIINDSNNNNNSKNTLLSLQKDSPSNSKHEEWAKQFDKIIEDFNNQTCRLGPDPELTILEGKSGDSVEGTNGSKTKTGDDLYKTFVNDDSEKKQNHVCIVDEPEGIDTFRFKRFLKKSHTRRNSKGKRIVRFLSRLSCVSESVQQQQPSPEHGNATCSKKARLANGNAYTTESFPLPAEREPVVLTASSASRLAHHYHYQRADSPTQFMSSITKEDDQQSPTSSNQSLDSLRSRTDSAYSSVSESAMLNSPQSQKTNLHLDPYSIINSSTLSSTATTPITNTSSLLHSPSSKTSSSSSSSRLVSHPDSAFSSMSESTLLSTSSLSAEDQTGNYSSDMLSALSDVFDQLEVCEDEIDQALLNRLRYSHRSAAHNRNN